MPPRTFHRTPLARPNPLPPPRELPIRHGSGPVADSPGGGRRSPEEDGASFGEKLVLGAMFITALAVLVLLLGKVAWDVTELRDEMADDAAERLVL